MSHPLPEGGADCLPNDFKINSLLELRKDLNKQKVPQQTCTKHNDPLKVYCETCDQVICACCIISEEHKEHHLTCKLISECYPAHYQQLQANLDQLKHKTAEMNAAVTTLVTREREVVQQGEEVKIQIHTHAQQLIDQVQKSERHLLQQVDTLVEQKLQSLKKQTEQADRVHSQLKACQEMVQQSLKEWSQLQVMIEKENIMYEMKAVGENFEPTLFQPIEGLNIEFTQASNITDSIGEVTSYSFGKATLNTCTMPCSPNTPSTVTLALQSHDGSPFSLPPSLISCKLCCLSDNQPIPCRMDQIQQGKHNINFTPCTTGAYQLIVRLGGVDISGSPFTLPVISPSSVLRGKPLKTVTGLRGPWGVTVCDNGDIVLAEWSAHCVSIINKKGKKIEVIW